MRRVIAGLTRNLQNQEMPCQARHDEWFNRLSDYFCGLFEIYGAMRKKRLLRPTGSQL
jgi:hypothetical protein